MKSEDFYITYLQHQQIVTDSRKVQPGCLYFALRGEHFNGNQFAADALAKGSAFAVVDDPSVVAGERFVLVPDVLEFLQELASIHRSKLSIPVIGLTGTNGKTTTKELIYAVLKQKFRTVATQGNLNNHIGVPLTLLSANESTEVLIVEMGANHPGEIAFLCNIARPTHGLITNIGKAHLEGFGSFEGVIRTKGELYTFIRNNQGTLFLNEDDPLLKELAGSYSCFTYGLSEQADLTGRAFPQGRYLSLTWKRKGSDGPVTINSHLTGDYNLYNILTAVSIGFCFGLNPDQIRAGIESYVPDNMRSQWIQTNSNQLFLDAYNANPSSMSLAISYFASMGLVRPVAILGDMFELGSHAAAEHKLIMDQADNLGFDQVIYVGKQFRMCAEGSKSNCFEELDEVLGYLSKNQITNSHVLIKGSRGMQLEKLVPYL